MKERPVLFSGPMVRAILEGRKTQTRRVMKPQPVGETPFFDRWARGDWDSRPFPYGRPGDHLWVRETWASVYDCPELPCCEDGSGKHRRTIYRATEPHEIDNFACSFSCSHDEPGCASWRPSIHMPRWASRLTLEVTGVRVERLQDISEEDARAEGLALEGLILPGHAAGCFSRLWDSINAKRASWASNPWVWVVSFRRVEAREVAA